MKWRRSMPDFYISVIVPCYNVEKYVARCIKSLMIQTIGYQNLQIILVNDASTDSTLVVLKEFENLFPDNIMVITYDENIRQGGARNIGMRYATGKYIGFVDSDDWIEPSMYKELYDKMESGDYDVVRCKLMHDSSESLSLFVVPSERCENQELVFEEKNGFYWAEPPKNKRGINGVFGGVYTGLYRRDFLISHNLFFPERCAYEDNYWGALLKLYVHKMYIIDIPYYHYYRNVDSTVRMRNSARHLDRLDVQEKLLEEYEKLGIMKYYYSEILNECIVLYYLNTLFLFFERFDECPSVDLYNRMSGTIYTYFEDWKKWVDMDLKSGPHELLLWWLDKYPRCNQESFNLLRDEYLNMIKP